MHTASPRRGAALLRARRWGMQVGSVRSAALSAALVDIYLGSDPPSAAMKADFLDTAAVTLGQRWGRH